MDMEVSFPRGRKNFNPTKNVDQSNEMQTLNGKSIKRKISDIDTNKKMSMASAELLTYQKIQEGMLILGCVRKIDTLRLEIELPGRVFGKVELRNLSSTYIKYLEECLANNIVDEADHAQKLDKLYFIGQIVPTKVMSIQKDEKTNVFLSIDPRDINSELYPAAYKAGMLLWAAVSSKVDHGYVLDAGNADCRVFLPSNNVPDGSEFEIGETLWCVVKKSIIDYGTATIHVSALQDEVIRATQNDINLHNCIPGTQFDFTITKILKNGLEGKLSNDNVGYVNEIHLRKPLQPLKKYKVGSTYKARLLYSEPLTKFLLLTFRRIDEFCAPEYSCGTIHTVQVISKTNSGVYVKLPNNDKGFVSEKRFLDSFINKGNNKLVTNVQTKFREGSTHQCRIICYNPLEQLYVCTPDKRSKEIASAQELHIGDLVKVKVIDIVEKGIVVKVGEKHGFIHNIHVSDWAYSSKIKNKFVAGQSLNVRVWNKCSDDSFLFTNKQTLVKADTYFNFEEAVLQQQYLGIVANIKTNGDTLIIFYGDVKGYLPKPNVDHFVGQVVLTKIIDKTKDALILSLPGASPKSNTDENINSRVKEIEHDHLIVKTKENLKAKSHLSKPLLKDSDSIIGEKEAHIVSPREAVKDKKNKQEVTGTRSEVCDYNETGILDQCENYLHNFKRTEKLYKKGNTLLSHLCIGQRVKCTVKKFDQSGCVVLINDTDLQGLVHKDLCPSKMSVDQKLEGVVIWINYAKNFVHVVLRNDIIKQISEVQDGDRNQTNSNPTAKVLMVDNDFVIAVLLDTARNNQLVFLPTHIHDNLLDLKMNNFAILERILVRIYRKVDNFLIGLEKTHKHTVMKYLKRKSNKNIKQTNTFKAENKVPHLRAQCSVSSDDEVTHTHKSDQLNATEKPQNNTDKHIALPQIMNTQSSESAYSSMSTYFTDENQMHTSETSDDEKDIYEPMPKKKKKLSAAERAEFAKQLELEIIKKELENANLSGDPQNPEQFDRLLLGNPNSSELWSKYITYFVTQSEFDKARAVGKRALNTIELDKSTERFNIWLVLLQFENNYGDKSTFEEVFEEAVRCNEPLDVYLEVIKMLAESFKYEEMETKVKKARNKFKNELKLWISLGNTYYKNKLVKEGRDLRNAALRNIQNKKDQLNIIVQFAIMEFRFGEIDDADVLFETILQSNPKRIDVWSKYIDQVIKSGDIDKARRLFDRLIVQDLAIKKKKTAFDRYKEFELKFGTKDTLNRLQLRANSMVI